MNRIGKRMTLVAAALSAAVVLPATAALADDGDGNLACNSGEICYTWDGTYTYQKHFWNAGNDDNYVFTNVTNGVRSGYQVRDNAWGVWNRDTACNVRIVDDRGFYPDDVQTIYRNGGWTKLIDSVRNQNDRHERC